MNKETCDACEHITDAYFYEEFTKGMGTFAANEWLFSVREMKRHRASQPSISKRSKLSPRDRCTSSPSKSDQSLLSLPQCAPPTCDAHQSILGKRKCLKIEAKDFNDLVLITDTISTPNDIFMQGSKSGKGSTSSLFKENFGLLYTDAAHVVLREAELGLTR